MRSSVQPTLLVPPNGLLSAISCTKPAPWKVTDPFPVLDHGPLATSCPAFVTTSAILFTVTGPVNPSVPPG